MADDLDYELCKDFFLNVEAFDGGTPPLRVTTNSDHRASGCQ